MAMKHKEIVRIEQSDASPSFKHRVSGFLITDLGEKRRAILCQYLPERKWLFATGAANQLGTCLLDPRVAGNADLAHLNDRREKFDETWRDAVVLCKRLKFLLQVTIGGRVIVDHA